MILCVAVCGKADFIISGDEDLLVLNPFRNIQIITPDSFLKIHSFNRGACSGKPALNSCGTHIAMMGVGK